MSYASRESSRTKGAPKSLYFFRYGDTPDAYYAYTDAEREVVLDFNPDIGPVTFKPIPIFRNAIVMSGVLDKAPLEIRTPHTAELAQLFVLYPPSQTIILTIFDGHLDEAQFSLAWSGRLLGSAREDDEAVYTCEPVSTSQKRTGLYRNYQYQCPLVLYSQGWKKCNANQAAATIVQGVGAVSGALVTLGIGWAPNEMKPKYAGGLATWVRADGRTERRSIVRIEDAVTILLSGLALGLTPGMAVDLTLGCNHDMDDCLDVHDNIHNFGGQFLIPKTNPIGIKNNFN